MVRKYEVVSIKPNPNRTGGARVGNQPGGRFVAKNVPLRTVVMVAFRPLQAYQIIGGPDWLTTERYHIEARADGTLTADEANAANQAMLEDRFQLKYHREMRELPTYNLIVVNRSKLKPVDAPKRPEPGAPPPAPPAPPPRPAPGRGLPDNYTMPPGGVMMTPNGVMASAIQFSELVRFLSQRLNRPIIDKTEITGYYNFRLEFAGDNTPVPIAPTLSTPGAGPPGTSSPTASDPLPSIFTALQEEMGLKLEPSKGQYEVVIIDSIQKPTEN
jgi:uncharacterized protein (TIGR03435 family)